MSPRSAVDSEGETTFFVNRDFEIISVCLFHVIVAELRIVRE